MRIFIKYNSIWQNSFLSGSNNEPVKNRKFKASSKSKETEDIKSISMNTILGVLSRLIGDQRKLYQAKNSDDFYFKDMDISFRETGQSQVWIETVSIINKSENRPPQNSFIGIIKEDEPLFFSEHSAILWSILDLTFEEILDFILNPYIPEINTKVSVTHILNRVQFEIETMDFIKFSEDEINELKNKIIEEKNKDRPDDKKIKNINNQILHLSSDNKKIEFECKLRKSIDVLQKLFPNELYIEKNKSIYPKRFYYASLYIMLQEFEKNGISSSNYLSKRKAIRGFSKRGFNGVRDFLNPLMGGKTKTTHTPYQLTKASGEIEITLNIDREKSEDLLKKIKQASVSSFYLGKKGLAYVSDIRLQ